MLCELGQHDRVVARVDHDGDVGVVLGRGADHGGAADVDVLDAGREVGALGDGRFERIEIDDEEIDRADAVRLHRARMLAVVADREQAAVHLGMQRLDAAVHHFGKAGELGDVEHGNAGIGQRLARAAGGNELDAVRGQRAGEIDQARLVGNGEEGARDAAEMVGHDVLASITADCSGTSVTAAVAARRRAGGAGSRCRPRPARRSSTPPASPCARGRR